MVTTALAKILFVNILELKFYFILVTVICWMSYIVYRIKQDDGVLKYWGFSRINLRETFKLLTPIGFILTALFLLIGYINGVPLLNWHIIPVLFLYPIWGLLQQFLILSLVAGNASDNKIAPRALIIAFTSILFGLIHYPDNLLMLATTLMAVAYTWVFLRWRNLWALGLFHGWLGGFFYFYVLNRDAWVEVMGALQ